MMRVFFVVVVILGVMVGMLLMKDARMPGHPEQSLIDGIMDILGLSKKQQAKLHDVFAQRALLRKMFKEKYDVWLADVEKNFNDYLSTETKMVEGNGLIDQTIRTFFHGLLGATTLQMKEELMAELDQIEADRTDIFAQREKAEELYNERMQRTNDLLRLAIGDLDESTFNRQWFDQQMTKVEDQRRQLENLRSQNNDRFSQQVRSMDLKMKNLVNDVTGQEIFDRQQIKDRMTQIEQDRRRLNENRQMAQQRLNQVDQSLNQQLSSTASDYALKVESAQQDAMARSEDQITQAEQKSSLLDSEALKRKQRDTAQAVEAQRAATMDRLKDLRTREQQMRDRLR